MTADLPEMVIIRAGPFRMGTPDVERSRLAKQYGGTRESYAEESPDHVVEVATFALATVPVTNELYWEFVQVMGARPPITWRGTQPPLPLRDHPVVDVRWDEAQAFCTWLKRQTGTAFRLPTEAEWEKAARGTDARRFPWGDDFRPACCNTREAGRGGTTAVGQYACGASPWGIFDLAGNVWEWTQSLQAAYPYRDDERNRGEESRHGAARLLARLLQRQVAGEVRRILRGGCYANPEGYARCACRFRLPPHTSTPLLGFRLAASV